MSIPLTTTERTELGGWLEGQGMSVEIIDRRAPWANWWRADGKPLGRLPADGYSMQLYRKKGFLLADPGGYVPEEPADFKLWFEQQNKEMETAVETGKIAPTLAASLPDLGKYTHSCGWTPRPDSKNFSSSLRFHARSCDKESIDG